MAQRRALIFWGGWRGHEPEACARFVAAMLEGDGFAVDLHEGVDRLAQPLAEFDLITPMITQSTIDDAAARNLAAAIEQGAGMAGFHGQMGDSFRDCVAYQFVVGGQWVAHPGDIVDYRVDVAAPDDPIMAGVEAFDYRSEQYYLHVDPANEVLATTTFTGAHAPWTKGVVMPVIWKRRHGRGRVFYSALGHQAAELDHPQASRIFRRGALWAARSVATR